MQTIKKKKFLFCFEEIERGNILFDKNVELFPLKKFVCFVVFSCLLSHLTLFKKKPKSTKTLFLQQKKKKFFLV